jgi:uncharacterized coiled-coil protein SlyX
MTKSPLPMFRQLHARLHDQAVTLDRLRTAVDSHLQRIAQMQANLDVLTDVRKRRQGVSAVVTH